MALKPETMPIDDFWCEIAGSNSLSWVLLQICSVVCNSRTRVLACFATFYQSFKSETNLSRYRCFCSL